MDYRTNSHRSKELNTEKKVEKVVTGNVKTVKKNELKKFKDIFVSEDASNVKSYILFDILVPAIKKAISDVVTNGIAILLYGESGAKNTNFSTASRISYVDYRNQYDSRNSTQNRVRGAYDYDDIVIPNRTDAENVIMRMDELIFKYGVASVGDLYDLVGLTSHNYTDNYYGWNDFRGAKAVPVNGGYLLKLPRPMPIN
ncbi:MAG: hypothetical protein GX660_25610 [Clostridiaceae bacterium]|nr:hypothetical protein [Clostridiaceae bacterium]